MLRFGQNQEQPMESMPEIWLCRDGIKQFLFYPFVSLQSEEKSTGNEINGIPCNYVMSTDLLSSCNIRRNLNTIVNVWYVRLLISKLENSCQVLCWNVYSVTHKEILVSLILGHKEGRPLLSAQKPVYTSMMKVRRFRLKRRTWPVSGRMAYCYCTVIWYPPRQ